MDLNLGSTFYKTGSLYSKPLNSTYKSMGKENSYKNNTNEKIKKLLIKVKIIYNKQNQTLEQIITSENSKENENEITEIEIYNTDKIRNLIKKYCDTKKLNPNNLFISKKDLKKIKSDLTINQAKIENNETIFINEGNEYNSNIDEENEITFNINCQGKSYSLSGNKNDLFLDCIEPFIKDNIEQNYNFIVDNKIIDKNKSLEELNIKSGSVVKFCEMK